MYQYSYSEILEDSVTDGRAAERRALDHAADLLLAAAETAPGSRAEQEALAFTSQLWGIFIKSLTSPDNDLPAKLRADLISVGLGILAEIARIDTGDSRDLAALADICGIIRDGLA
ncbi:flagellar biosynthesis regulator FlaF [Lichenihabitans sp. Uapishka_5]|uniref:flagellar biosynthesis regulator FlaF n=1 Tax=Lichenihabitans sp. Uapishka_5 TaxID=3037302 RepID=UPI0029E7CF3A|nr:flagellar biosynthesis regulator FlaF [Lichenihabitans sp. Uapishka_5]MDX7953067.1 flagellar biosynthesis regulator FlaF [Lichenihabitans sp. Uapishka_5]